MLYEWLAADSGILNVLNYITFRTGAAVVTAFLVTVIFGDTIINFLRARQGKGQPIRDLSLEQQLEKRGTPTMGGFLIWLGLVVGVLLWANLNNPYIWVTLFVTLSYAILGFLDDYAKVTKQTDAGVSAKVRLLAGFGIAAVACAFIMGLHGAHTPEGHAEWGALNGLAEQIAAFAPQTSVTPADPDFSGGVAVPFVNNYFLPLGMFFILFGMIVVVGSANAVNFTDGLDGLAIVPMTFAAAAYAMIAYLTGNFVFAEYLGIQFAPGAGELAVLLGAMMGAGMGFLWYNAYPAKVFMGDTGSLGLGGMLGVVAVATKHEFALVVIGGLFVIEALSVIMQVIWFKLTRRLTGEGKRIFLMAPLHHHFQKKNWPETRVVVRFWILSVLFALAGLATLKLR
ncbi:MULTISPECIES: phospho-N-acetylmuramoyl-pentapeptide-transferase [unclassified Hyphomonas]|jgi:phospho-N-acetylmuramoyl-pentapeptide-transferase|uniref:phospho-N-acetylmuramoyl-pentapeptide- transferase n=1 Tax=unclassified Hyphomonas TaxID=2630699 RepID=UPI000458E818|nr:MULTISPECIES: phospho-N-acetylmuramoyl-pentapeptide-transferase [unclassified Hyphomonas]KCZ49935.1 phospho-N-acetylmuramoyl-pentapeptide-transferase [Hyphomonas sp. CY54-11-8]RAN38608.1 phospho-N-acetylmuramoyl-pentapeptide-transferase [Hyphomonas sp. GM-8P]